MLNTPYHNSMVWFEGVVENRIDPLKVSRVQVRVFGIHSDDLTKIPESSLFWMTVMNPVTSAAISGIGDTPNLVEGTHVIGFFRDGAMYQDGVVLGSVAGIPIEWRKQFKGFYDHRTNLSPSSVPGKPSSVTYVAGSGVRIVEKNRSPYPLWIDEPDTSRLARNENPDVNTVLAAKKLSQSTQINIKTAGGTTFSEPTSPYNAVYPYNKVRETESGHVMEFDDTPTHERVHIAHRTGSFIEMHPNGDVVNKSAKDKFNIVHANSYEHVEGTKYVTIDKGAKLLINAKGGSQSYEIEVGAGGNMTIKVTGGNLAIEVEGDITQKVSGNYIVEVGGDYSVLANTISLN